MAFPTSAVMGLGFEEQTSCSLKEVHSPSRGLLAASFLVTGLLFDRENGGSKCLRNIGQLLHPSSYVTAVRTLFGRYLSANLVVETARPKALCYGRKPIKCVLNGQELTNHRDMKKQREWKNNSMNL
jgi:hypothetical protein